MKVSDRMKDIDGWLTKSKLIPIDFQPKIGDLIIEEKDMMLRGNEVVKRHTGKHGSIAFIVRRPGWVLCREHGQQLTNLKNKKSAAETNNNNNNDNKFLDGFELFGIVKETGVDDAGLTDFHENHYPYPTYRDENLDFYNAFGENKKITDSMSWSMLLNPFKLYGGMKEVGARMKKKGIEGNMVGEGLKTGGIIIFDNAGQPKYSYPEITGYELNEDDLLAAVQSVRNGGKDDGITNSEL